MDYILSKEGQTMPVISSAFRSERRRAETRAAVSGHQRIVERPDYKYFTDNVVPPEEIFTRQIAQSFM
jgi:hypothetical protein